MTRWLAILLLGICNVAVAGTSHAWTLETLAIPAPGLAGQPLRVRVLLPPGYARTRTDYPVLFFDDGQDMEAVRVRETLEQLDRTHEIQRIIAVAIDMPSDRMGAYGFSDRAAGHSISAPTKYGNIGASAQAYAQWLAATLAPELDRRYRVRAGARNHALLGWSLGGAQAINMVLQYPEVFAKAGAFSPSLWLATDNASPQNVQETRIAQSMLAHAAWPRGARLFIGVGTAEETADRDGDGVIDVIDDAEDLMQGWRDPQGVLHPGAAQAGASINLDFDKHPGAQDVVLHRLQGGIHRQDSWAQMLPMFLRWAYGHAGAVRTGRARP